MRVRSALALALVLTGCGGAKEPPPPATEPGSATAPEPRGPAPEAEGPAFPAGTRSLELIRTVSVRLEPADDAKRIGTVAIDTRVRWTRTATARGCKAAWVEIAPRGWICGDYVKPSTKAPLGREVPMLDRGELVPGVYGKVTATSAVAYALQTAKAAGKGKGKGKAPPAPVDAPVTSTREVDPAAPVEEAAPLPPDTKLVEGAMVADHPLVGSITVRQYDQVAVGGKAYWKVSPKDNEYILASAIRQHTPSVYSGARLADDTGWALPIAFVWPRGEQYSAYSLSKAGGGSIVRTLARRTAVPIVETAVDKAGAPTAYRIGDGEWLRAGDVRVFAAAPPPALLTRGERWIDIDLDTQILVAFEGELPVFATMISSGAKDTPTETGTYRMWLKQSEADMKDLKSEDPYSVSTVPWTQFFFPERGLALHTAYWHDQFGTRRSHGCVNLAPRDARWLYFWSDPQVPPGWTMAAGLLEAPGSIVRVRTKAEPAPPLKGYAKQVDEQRRQNRARP